jgi:hypothetical protein
MFKLSWICFQKNRIKVWTFIKQYIGINFRTSQKAHHLSAAEPKQLMLFGETVAIYCEKRTEHADTLCKGLQNIRILEQRLISCDVLRPNVGIADDRR